MKCTQCGTKVRPVVASDIDGTMADYHGFYGNFACDFWAVSHPSVPWDGRGDFEDYLRLTREEYRTAKMAYRQGGMKRIQPAYDGLGKLTMMLRNMSDAEVWVTTTRPWKRLDNIDPDTQWWLDRNKVPYTHLLYDDDKYAVLRERVGEERVAFILEDLPDQYERAVEIFGEDKVWMIARPHNSHYRNGRYNTVQMANGLVTAAIQAGIAVDTWIEEHQ